jgi:hypothetical protein
MASVPDARVPGAAVTVSIVNEFMRVRSWLLVVGC